MRRELGAGVVLTGGGAALPGMVELAADVFGSGVRTGAPVDRVTGLDDAVASPRFATVVGLAQYAAARLTIGAAGSGGRRAEPERARAWTGSRGRVKSWLQDFF